MSQSDPAPRSGQYPVRTPGVIEAASAYTVPEFRRRCGLGDYAWRQLRKELPLRRVGKKQFLLGADWISYLAGLPKHSSEAAPTSAPGASLTCTCKGPI